MGKRKTESKITREFSAGGVVFKKEVTKTTFLIIKPSGSNRWQLPKGIIDEGESSKDAAVREVREEGGVEVELLEKLGTSQYFFVLEGERIFKTVTYFLMEYKGDGRDGHDSEVDEVQFLPFEEAYEKLTYKDDKEILKKAKEILERGIQSNLI